MEEELSLHPLPPPGGASIAVKLHCEILENLSGLFCLRTRKQSLAPTPHTFAYLKQGALLTCTLFAFFLPVLSSCPFCSVAWAGGTDVWTDKQEWLWGPSSHKPADRDILIDPSFYSRSIIQRPEWCLDFVVYLLGQIHRELPNLSPPPPNFTHFGNWQYDSEIWGVTFAPSLCLTCCTFSPSSGPVCSALTYIWSTPTFLLSLSPDPLTR